MVFYFTATGNSLYVAKCIEEYPVSIPQVIKNSSIYSDNQIGIICPVYCGEIPNTVKEFLKESKFDTKYMYLILTYGNSASDCPEFTYNEFKALGNWTDDNSRVSVEHNDESKRDVPLTKTTPDHWADYDKVFIGYPIWWGIAAWPVNNFVKSNDFSGKTVIPFCTSSSSGLGQSGDLLADMAGTGNWQDGERFSSGASSSKVESWVNGLDLK